jgi:hypothetical protein
VWGGIYTSFTLRNARVPFKEIIAKGSKQKTRTEHKNRKKKKPRNKRKSQ